MDIKETLGEELYNQVTEKLGNKKFLINDGNYVPKTRLDEVISQKKTYEEQVSSFSEKLKEFEKLSESNEELKGKVKELNEMNAKIKTEAEKNLETTKFNHLLDLGITSAGAKNAKAVKALLDLSEVKRDGDSLLHLDKQLETLKESDPYLFNEKEPPKTDASKTVNRNKPGEKKKFDTWADWRKEHIGS